MNELQEITIFAALNAIAAQLQADGKYKESYTVYDLAAELSACADSGAMDNCRTLKHT